MSAISESTLEHATSADGTTIAYVREGRGPAVIIVQGAFCDRRSAAALAAGMRGRFTVYRYDRRGRGDSGDTPPWVPAREIEDLAAIVAAAGEPPFVYGHSSGAALALEAAAAKVSVRRLLAYEPPYTGPGDVHAAQLDRLGALVAEGDLDAAVDLFLRGAGTPPGVMDRLRASPTWPAMTALARALPYDVALTNGGEVPVDRLERVTVPVLAVAGGLSPDWAHRACDAIAAVVPEGRSELAEGQTHAVVNRVLLPILSAFFV
jgi:pimeloyl-ACP methyl ester carboxylesterase